MKYKLLKPVEFAGTIFEDVEIREAYNYGDWCAIRGVGKDEGKQMEKQVSIAIDWPVIQVQKLSVKDGLAILEMSTSFFTDGEESEKTSTTAVR